MRSSGRGERRDRQGSELCDGKSKEIQKERGGGEERKGGWHGERESSRRQTPLTRGLGAAHPLGAPVQLGSVSSINGTKIVLEKFTNENQIKNCSDTVTQRLYSPESLQFVGLDFKTILPILCMIHQKDTNRPS